MKTIPVWIKFKLRYESLLIDDDDFERVSLHSWYAELLPFGIVVRSKINNKTTSLASFILREGEKQIDHKDRNPFNNQKENLRFCTQQQNVWNQGPRIGCTYKGVSYHKAAKKWSAQINKNYKKIHLGLFATEIQAAKAYDRAAKKYFGEFAYLNFKTE